MGLREMTLKAKWLLKKRNAKTVESRTNAEMKIGSMETPGESFIRLQREMFQEDWRRRFGTTPPIYRT